MATTIPELKQLADSAALHRKDIITLANELAAHALQLQSPERTYLEWTSEKNFSLIVPLRVGCQPLDLALIQNLPNRVQLAFGKWADALQVVRDARMAMDPDTRELANDYIKVLAHDTKLLDQVLE